MIYGSVEGQSNSLFWRLADGTGAEEPLTKETAYRQNSEAISPDGKFVALMGNGGPRRANDLFLLSLEDRTTGPLVEQTEFNESQAAFSPDGHWLAYQSNSSGRSEVYVQPFPAVAEGKWQVSTAGGRWPLWSPDGRELFYTSLDLRLMATAVDTKGTFSYGTPVALFDMKAYINGNPGRPYDITRDGRFLAVKNVNPTEIGRLQVVEHWFDGLTARAK